MIRDTQAQDTLITPPSPWRRFRWPLAGALVMAVLLVWLAMTGWMTAGASASISRARLSIATVQRGDLIRDVAAEGRVIAAVSPTLYAASAGSVRLDVVAGRDVQRGDVLGSIDSPELSSRLAQESAALQALEVDYGRARLETERREVAAKQALDQARVDRQVARTEYERMQRAFDLGVVPEVELTRARAVLDKAELSWTSAKTDATLEQRGREYDVDAARLARDRQSLIVAELQRQVDLLTLRAPVSGQVGQLLVADRATVAKDAPLLTVVDLSALEVELQIAESFARDLAAGMPATIRGNGGEWPGTVASVAPEVVAGEVRARVRFDGAVPQGLRQSQRMSVRVVLDSRENVLTLARGPFIETGSGLSAYVVDGEFAQRRSIRLGSASIDRVEVLEGLQPGDQVVISGSDSFRQAERVALSR